jgi:hypothetical protein
MKNRGRLPMFLVLSIGALAACDGGLLSPEEIAQTEQQLVSTPVLAEGIDDGGLADNAYATGDLLLRSFDFMYQSEDHHLGGVVALTEFPTGNNLRVGFFDQNRDDDYFFRVGHHDAVESRIQRVDRSLDICVTTNGRCTVPISRPAGDVVFVLTGFEISYQTGIDHHLDEIGLLENNGQLTVIYNDASDNKTFLWRVQFAWVPADLFTGQGTVSGVADSGGADIVTPVSGKGVIRGFRFNFEPHFTPGEDHHIKRMAVYMLNDRVSVLYHDRNSDDGFDWQVRWGRLED